MLIVVLALVMTGCSTVVPAETEPLEDRAETLYGQVEFELQLIDIVLLNPYLEAESPRVDEFDAARVELLAATELLARFSINVIDAARDSADSEAVAVIVPLIRDLYSDLRELPMVESHLTGLDVETLLADAARQPSLIKAFRAAAPVNNEIANALRGSIDEASDRFDLAFDETYDKIMDENQSFMTYTDNLIFRRNEILDKLLLVDDARQGDATAWQTLQSEDEELQRAMAGTAGMPNVSIDRAESNSCRAPGEDHGVMGIPGTILDQLPGDAQGALRGRY